MVGVGKVNLDSKLFSDFLVVCELGSVVKGDGFFWQWGVFQHLQTALSNRNVLEIACGTGYCTQVISETASHITATDINEPMLEIARQKEYPRNNVVFKASDMYALQPGGDFDALFGGFIWSHIPVQELEQWLDHLHRLLKPGSHVVFTDNNFVAGSNTPLSSTDGHGNVFQERMLPNGESYQIIKNFPGKEDFERLLKNRGTDVRVKDLEYYWVLEYIM